MKNEYLEILYKGAEYWNEWRSKKINEKINLREMMLDRRDFSNYNFENCMFGLTYFFSSTFTNCNFEHSVFRETNFDWSNLKNSNFNNAAFIDATAKGADFTNCKFKNTLLAGTNFAMSNFKNATFHNNHVSNLILCATNLSGAKGLKTLKHSAFSMIDHITIQKSESIPFEFLRGCGLSDILIDNYPSLLNNAINFYSCFLSHSSKDVKFVDSLYEYLISTKIQCWYSVKDLKIGDKFRSKIDESINYQDKLIIVLSKNSIESQWIEQEIESALEKERKNNSTVLFPIMIDSSVMKIDSGWAKYIRNTRNIGNYTDWKTKIDNPNYFVKLVNDLKK